MQILPGCGEYERVEAGRNQTLRREREQGIFHFPCSADHEQYWQTYSHDAHSVESVSREHTIIR